jgi:hypothetical protein
MKAGASGTMIVDALTNSEGDNLLVQIEFVSAKWWQN